MGGGHMRVVFTYLGIGTPAQYVPNVGGLPAIIKIDADQIKRRVPRWRSYLVAAFAHEMTHHVLYNVGWELNTPYDVYKQELVCYRVQMLVESILGMRHTVDSVEHGAWLSTVSTIRYMKRCVLIKLFLEPSVTGENICQVIGKTVATYPVGGKGLTP
jgi:hypothetical protein